jgi:sugar/nucleoside kinase (ribokinase family)
VAFHHDIVFIGHVAVDEIHPFEGATHRINGGAVQFSAMAAASWSDKKIAVITRMAEKDEGILDEMRKAGIVIYSQHSSESTFMSLIHSTENPDERQLFLRRSAGYFSIDDLPDIEPCRAHLVGITDHEFTFEFMSKLKNRGFMVSVDMQSFVRRVDTHTGAIYLEDVPLKKDIAATATKIKLDAVEAKVLTGTENPEDAAITFEKWGTDETLITNATGVLVRSKGQSYFERFSNRSNAGRTGRGDSTFAAYLTYRIDHDVAESLKFAAALASIKVETPGVFRGTLEQILTRIETDRFSDFA